MIFHNLRRICLGIFMREERITMKQKSILKPSFNTPPESYWTASVQPPEYPQLEGDIITDVAIVGGGIAGITTALLLKRAGVKVVVLEANIIGHGTTGYSTAKITSQHGLVYKYLVDKFGFDKAKLYADAMQDAVKFIGSMVHEMNIDCGYMEVPSFVYTQLESFIKIMEQEADAAIQLKLPASYVADPGLPFNTKCAVRFDGQAQFHPLKYLYRLAQEIPGNGCHIFQNSRVLHLDEENLILSTENGTVKASAIVIATRYPFYDKPNLYFTRMTQSRSYLMAVRAAENFPDGMFISAEDPVRTFRTHYDGSSKIIIMGGTGHDTGQGDNTYLYYEDIRNYAKKVLTVTSIDYQWSSQDAITVDSVPYIGPISEGMKNVYVATGFKKWGITSGTLSGMIISDLITRGENKYSDMFSPQRINIAASATDFLKNNVRVAKDFIFGRLDSPDERIEDIKPGTGKIITYDKKKLAVYKDENNKIYALDPYCTHLGCELVWNEAEKSWDCPCHGSRFSYNGQVLDTPASKPLPIIELDD